MVIRVLALCMFFFCSSPLSGAMNTNLFGGDWQLTVTAADFNIRTGFTTSFLSADGEAKLRVKGTNNPWDITHNRVDSNWPPEFLLSVKRTTIDSALSGGTSFIPIVLSETDFYSGQQMQGKVSLQYSLEGVSSAVSPGIYTTTVFYNIQEQ